MTSMSRRSSPAPLLLVAGFALGLALILLVGLAREAQAATTPPGFVDGRVVGVAAPTALAFTPDGRMLVSSQGGQLRVYRGETLVQDPALSLAGRACTNSERGLLGVAVDPEFETNKFVYLYYTFNRSDTCVNRVSRFVLGDNNVVAPSSEKVLIDNVPSPAGNHNAGDVHFGKDDNLYVSIGDGGCDYAGNSGCAGNNDAARDPHVLLGKILRIMREGGVPADNPYVSGGARCALTGFASREGQQCQETFASGLRNPFRFAFDPDANGTRFFVNDVGQNRFEEINEGRAGADYGWNHCEGNYDNPSRPGVANCQASFTPPIHDYDRSVGASITGGAFVPNGVWPARYDDSYLFGDFVSGKIFELDGGTRSDFVSGLGGGSAVAMTFGPYAGTQALYYTTYAGGGEVRRVAYTEAPTASVAVGGEPYDATAPYEFAFDGSASRGVGALQYLWDFGDGQTATTTEPAVSHAFAEATNRKVTLTVRDGTGKTSAPATVDVYPGDDAPQPVIEAPGDGATFGVDEEITLTGSATDPEDGALSGTGISWEVVRHHNDSHSHPYRSGTGTSLKFPAPAPEDLNATGPGNHLEVRFTATDSRGLKRTVTRRIEPRRVGVSFETSPSGLGLVVNGASVTGPRTLTSWEGYDLSLSAPNQGAGGRTYAFATWSDGGAQSHTVKTGTNPATYAASFSDVTPPYVPPPPTPNYAAPTISRPSPAPGASTRDRTPTISALVRDSQTDLAGARVTLFLDGRRVNASYSQASNRLKYTPRNPLRGGRHTVRVIANDGALSSSRVWRFRVTE